MKEKFEQKLEPKEQPTSRIILEFFRHGKREKTKYERGEAPEEDIEEEIALPLTKEGRQQMTKRGKEMHSQPEVALSVGSPRKRTQETAARVMLAEKEKITPEMSLEEIEEIINSEQKYGKKIISDPRLDFNVSGPAGEKLHQAYLEGKTMQHLIYESDKDAIELKDSESTTYSRAAGDLSELITKYLKIAPNFDKIVKKNPEKYAPYNNQMERYLGTHLSNPGAFLAKVLEKTKGEKERDEFVKAIGGGFKQGEGFRVEINNTPEGMKLEIKYEIDNKKENIEVPPEILDEIIKERDELDEKIEKRS